MLVYHPGMGRRRRSARPLLALATVALLVVGSACGRGEPTGAEQARTLSEGLRAHSAGRLDEAARLYGDVLEHDPDNKFAHYNLGLIEQIRGGGRAEAEYREALRIDPNFAPALFNLAIIRAQAGSVQEAIDLYRRVIGVDPKHADAHLNLGFLLREIGQNAEGDAELAKATELDPSLASRIPPSPTPEGPARPAS